MDRDLTIKVNVKPGVAGGVQGPPVPSVTQSHQSISNSLADRWAQPVGATAHLASIQQQSAALAFALANIRRDAELAKLNSPTLANKQYAAAMAAVEAHNTARGAELVEALRKKTAYEQSSRREEVAHAALTFQNSPSRMAGADLVAKLEALRASEQAGTAKHLEVLRDQIEAQKALTRETKVDAETSAMLSRSTDNLQKLLAVANAQVMQASGGDIGDALAYRRKVAGDVRQNAASVAASEYHANPTLASTRDFIAKLDSVRQNERVASDKHVQAIRDQIEAQKTESKLRLEDRRVYNQERFGRRIGGFMNFSDGLRDYGVGTMSGRAFAAGTAGILGTLAAGSPASTNTLTGSLQLLTGEIGQSFIPQVVQMSSALQGAYRWIRDMDDGTKRTIATTGAWGVALTGGVYALTKVVDWSSRAIDKMATLRDRFTAVTTGPQLAPGIAPGSWNGGVAPTAAASGSSWRGALGANAGMIGGIAGAGLFAYGQMAPDSPWASTANTLGIAGMLAGASTPAGAGFGAFSRRFIPAAAGIALFSELAADRSVRLQGNAPITPAGNAIAERVREALRVQEEAIARRGSIDPIDRVRRFNAAEAALAGSGITMQMAGLTSDHFGTGNIIPGPLGANQVNNIVGAIAQTASRREISGPPIQERIAEAIAQADRLQRASQNPTLPARTRLELERASVFNRQEAAQLGQNNLLYSMNFQSQQGGIEGLRNMVQMEITRDPMQQEQFAMSARELQKWTDQISAATARLAALNAQLQNPQGAAP